MKNLILLHGALGCEDLFTPLIEEIREHYNCYTFNFSGHGGVPFRNGFSINQFASELNEFMDDNNIDACDIFGHSMGGYVALYASAMGNEKIENVITLGTKFLWTKEIGEKESAMLDIEKLRIKAPAFIELMELRHGENWDRLIIQVKKMLLELGAHQSLTDELLNKINIPVTLLRGENDRMVSLEETQNTELKIESCNFISLPSQPHLLEQVDTSMLRDLLLIYA